MSVVQDFSQFKSQQAKAIREKTLDDSKKDLIGFKFIISATDSFESLHGLTH